MSDSLSHLLRGRVLRDQGRHDEAENYFKQAIAADPADDQCYAELALCLLAMDGRRRDALARIDDAIANAPDQDYHHAVRALILSKLKRGREALVAADHAIALDPDSAFNHAAKADAFATLERWADAEKEARAALTLDPDNDFATNLLATLLRLQGKQWESEVAVDRLLANNPEDAFAHCNAGWSALQAGNTEKAEQHFREALRLDPEFDAARDGLLESFKARSAFYRVYMRYCFFMARMRTATRWALIIGLLLAIQFGSRALEKVSPLAAGLLIAGYLVFVLWVWLASGVGSFLVMMDKSARHALKESEKLEGTSVGGGVLLAVVLFALGVIFGHLPTMILAVIVAISTIPASLTFTNEQPRGRRVFGSIYAGVLAIGVFAFALESWRGTRTLDQLSQNSETLLMIALVGAMACTWLGNVSSLRERAD